MPKPKKPIILPRKMSKLIRIALRDLEKAEHSRSYVINMDQWHQPQKNHCVVCLAGSVMAFSLKAKKTESLTPACYIGSEDNCDQLCAINYLRIGDVNLAAISLDLKGRYSRFNRCVVSYKGNPKKFKRDMRKLVRDLAAEGL